MGPLKWAIKLMNDLTDDQPLTTGGEMTFELINHYLQVLMQHQDNWRLICCRKTDLNVVCCVG